MISSSGDYYGNPEDAAIRPQMGRPRWRLFDLITTVYPVVSFLERKRGIINENRTLELFHA